MSGMFFPGRGERRTVHRRGMKQNMPMKLCSRVAQKEDRGNPMPAGALFIVVYLILNDVLKHLIELL